MNKSCARCEKTVYPIEELKCLDKIWHKGCFKCQACGMTLNMKTYKGFNKQPYCEAHIPKAKATTMAETPELKRIAENTKIQSNVKYHEDFEKSKGKFTQVADDPELKRIQQNSRIISNVAYHGELQKKAAMEQKRINENGHGNVSDLPKTTAAFTNNNNNNVNKPQDKLLSNHQNDVINANIIKAKIGKISDYDPSNNSPYSARQHQTLIYSSDRGAVNNVQQRKIGSVADYDPLNNVYGSIAQNVNTNMNINNSNVLAGKIYRAMYDYEAQEQDEVSFLDGDLIINVTNIHAGWMTGQVQRTGQVGMLPANYVELLHI